MKRTPDAQSPFRHRCGHEGKRRKEMRRRMKRNRCSYD
jgi:hypothetical protein